MKSYEIDMPCYSKADGKFGTFEPPTIIGCQVNLIFYIFDVPEGEARANHACMNSSIVFIAMAGEVSLSVETDEEKKEYLLNNNSIAVFAPQTSWIKSYGFSKDAVLVGLSDRRYADRYYINDYGRYGELLREEY